MDVLDDFLRYGAIGLLSWLAVWVLRDFCNEIRGRLGVALAISQIAYLLCSKPGLHFTGVDPEYFLFPFCVLGGIIAWLFCLSQFDDHFELRPWHWGVIGSKLFFGIVMVIGLQLDNAVAFKAGAGVSSSIMVGTMLHLVFVTWRDRGDDLMESRYRFRSIFVAAVVIISAGILAAEWYLLNNAMLPFLLPLQSAAFFGTTFFVLWRLSGPDGIEIFAFSDTGADDAPGPPTREDKHDLAALEAQIRDEKIYLAPGLTIARLAKAAGMPEHRLRRLINQQLGYRNFSDYLNHHRVAAAKDRLADADERHVPVLTIAMDLGYGSLGPFNRAFKERTGATPTAFRKNALAET